MNVHRSDSVSIKDETVAAAAKSALPVSVTGGLIFGVSISEFVQWVTLAFLLLQIGLLIPKYWSFLKGLRRRKNETD